jgi:hypothetical protein
MEEPKADPEQELISFRLPPIYPVTMDPWTVMAEKQTAVNSQRNWYPATLGAYRGHVLASCGIPITF